MMQMINSKTIRFWAMLGLIAALFARPSHANLCADQFSLYTNTFSPGDAAKADPDVQEYLGSLSAMTQAVEMYAQGANPTGFSVSCEGNPNSANLTSVRGDGNVVDRQAIQFQANSGQLWKSHVTTATGKTANFVTYIFAVTLAVDPIVPKTLPMPALKIMKTTLAGTSSKMVLANGRTVPQ